MGIFIICRVCGANSPLLPWFRRQKVAKRGGGNLCAHVGNPLSNRRRPKKQKSPNMQVGMRISKYGMHMELYGMQMDPPIGDMVCKSSSRHAIFLLS